MKYLRTALIGLMSIVVLASASQASAANIFYGSKTVMGGEWSEEYWKYFNGCEEDNARACLGASDGNGYFDLGDYSVKQGVYQLGGNTPEYAHGKMILKYSYKLVTNEASDSTADTGIIKLKDVDTNEVLYLAEYSSAAATDEWVDVTKRFSGKLLNRTLQLVFEVDNDADNLTVFSVDTVSMVAKSNAEVKGTVEYKDSGKRFDAEGATVSLMNKKGTKVIKTTTTDSDGEYAFFPVERKKKYKVVATYGDLTGEEVMSKKTKRGRSYTEDITVK